MRAAYIEAVGPPEAIVIGERPNPTAGQGEVLVRVGAAAINPIDLYIRAGTVPMTIPFPYVVGCDLAGTVIATGLNATKFRLGDRVWGSNQGLLGRQGTCCEIAAVHEDWLYPTPTNVTDVEASSMALVGITAHLGLFERGRLASGETVYVPGGAGGVGSMVIQMAKAVGARVATSAGRSGSADRCMALGADLVVNYREEDLSQRLRAFAPEGIDLWYETQREPNLELAVPLLRRRGRLILIAGRAAASVLPVGPFYLRNAEIHGFAMFNFTAVEQRRCAFDLNRWIESGQIKASVGRVFPVSETAEAHRFLEDNTLRGAGTLLGKVVVSIT